MPLELRGYARCNVNINTMHMMPATKTNENRPQVEQQSTEQPVDQPIEQSIEQPDEQPVEQPVEQPAEPVKQADKIVRYKRMKSSTQADKIVRYKRVKSSTQEGFVSLKEIKAVGIKVDLRKFAEGVPLQELLKMKRQREMFGLVAAEAKNISWEDRIRLCSMTKDPKFWYGYMGLYAPNIKMNQRIAACSRSDQPKYWTELVRKYRGKR